MKKITYLFLFVFLLLTLGACQSKNPDTPPGKNILTSADISGKHYAEIEIENYGIISLELDADQAPISVYQFTTLAKEGFYDGLTFHRIIKNFMIQGGDPLGNGYGGAEQKIKGEFSDNGVKNTLLHTRGAISFARSKEFDSASSQFFIVHQEASDLDGQYAVFGYVTSGMEIIDQICENTSVEDNNGTTLPENQPIIKTIRISNK